MKAPLRAVPVRRIVHSDEAVRSVQDAFDGWTAETAQLRVTAEGINESLKTIADLVTFVKKWFWPALVAIGAIYPAVGKIVAVVGQAAGLPATH